MNQMTNACLRILCALNDVLDDASFELLSDKTQDNVCHACAAWIEEYVAGANESGLSQGGALEPGYGWDAAGGLVI